MSTAGVDRRNLSVDPIDADPIEDMPADDERCLEEGEDEDVADEDVVEREDMVCWLYAAMQWDRTEECGDRAMTVPLTLPGPLTWADSCCCANAILVTGDTNCRMPVAHSSVPRIPRNILERNENLGVAAETGMVGNVMF